MGYKYQLHTHTAPTSRCGAMSPKELAEALKGNGYQGAVMTNHFFYGNTGIDRNIPWCDFVREYENDYLACKKEAEKYDLDIIFCIEQHIGEGREIIPYGITPDFLYSHPDLKCAGIDEWCDAIKKVDALIIQAHPYRDRAYISAQYPLDPNKIDGIEVYNYANTPVCNERAEEFAKAHPEMILTSGADTHQPATVGFGGIECEERIKDTAALVNMLRNGNYKILR